ncbi:UNVERIFIED_CONTAM: hypothetical protein Sangu_3207000, partial [Sesamum angustifolium]
CFTLAIWDPCVRHVYMCITAYLLREWKSLLDVIKEIRVCSNMTLEEAFNSYAHPTPMKKSVICQKCNGEPGLLQLNFLNVCII